MEQNHARAQIVQKIDKMEKEALTLIKNSDEYRDIIKELKSQNREKDAEFKKLHTLDLTLKEKVKKK